MSQYITVLSRRRDCDASLSNVNSMTVAINIFDQVTECRGDVSVEGSRESRRVSPAALGASPARCGVRNPIDVSYVSSRRILGKQVCGTVVIKNIILPTSC
jgi:hypothetical protein